MSPFLQIASRVEAAVEAYTSVRDFADEQVWKESFKIELKNTLRALRPHLSANPPSCPDLHPTLIALTIVLRRDEDLGRINRSHPDLNTHEFYKVGAEFPDDISDLLPSGSADRWWERLAEAACRERPAQTAPSKGPRVKLPKRLKVKGPHPPSQQKSEEKRDSAVGDKDVAMEIDEEPEDPRPPERSNVVKSAAAAATKKRKGSTTASDGTAKRPAKSTKRSGLSEQHPGASNADLRDDDPRLYDFQCDRCFGRDEACGVDPEGPCQQCKQAKQGCSLFPKNPNTKKADRRPWTRQDFFKFREKQKMEQAEKRREILEKRKRRARGSPASGDPEPSALDTGEPEASDAGEPEPSAPVPSPTVPTSGLGALTLDSGASSAANTPAESPMTVPQHPLPQNISPAPPTPPETRRASGRATESPTTVPQHPLPQNVSPAPPTPSRPRHVSGHATESLTTIPQHPRPQRSSPAPPAAPKASGSTSGHIPTTKWAIEIPSAPQHLRAARRQCSHSHSDVSLASDDGAYSARIATVEKNQEQLEKWMRDIDNRVKQLEKK